MATESPTTESPTAESVVNAQAVDATSVGSACGAEEEHAVAPPTPAVANTPAQPRPTPAARKPEVEPINLIESAGPAIAKRLIPVAIGAVLLFLLLRRRARS